MSTSPPSGARPRPAPIATARSSRPTGSVPWPDGRAATAGRAACCRSTRRSAQSTPSPSAPAGRNTSKVTDSPGHSVTSCGSTRASDTASSAANHASRISDLARTLTRMPPGLGPAVPRRRAAAGREPGHQPATDWPSSSVRVDHDRAGPRAEQGYGVVDREATCRARVPAPSRSCAMAQRSLSSRLIGVVDATRRSPASTTVRRCEPARNASAQGVPRELAAAGDIDDRPADRRPTVVQLPIDCAAAASPRLRGGGCRTQTARACTRTLRHTRQLRSPAATGKCRSRPRCSFA